MTIIPLSYWDIVASMVLVLVTGLSASLMGLEISRSLYISTLRMIAQLSLVGLILKFLFENYSLLSVTAMALVMLLIAGHEVRARQKYRLRGVWGYGIGTVSMLFSSFLVTLITLQSILELEVWYDPRYAIPILGMLLGNTMSGIGLGLDQLTRDAWEQRDQIEGRLALGQRSQEAIAGIRLASIRSGMIPVINMLSASGLVSLPGMMTGQILAGIAPLVAVKYQILIMCLIAAGTGFGTFLAVGLGSRRLFDGRQRLRLDFLSDAK